MEDLAPYIIKSEAPFAVEEFIITNVKDSSTKPKLQNTNSSLIHYLVCVPEFTDLSGNQVSLVILHLHGIDILLTQKRQKQKTNTLNAHQLLQINYKSLNKKYCSKLCLQMYHANTTSSFFSFRFLLRG